MLMVQPLQTLRRRAAVLPMVTVCLVALVGCVALAVDIGLIADARTEMQDHVDAAVMAGVRELEGISADNSKTTAENTAKDIAKLNNVFGKQITDPVITSLQVGVYRYDSAAQKFEFKNEAPQVRENYGAVRMTITMDQPLFFARVFGFTKQTLAVSATAVARPRDVAMILDFSGSMGYSSEINYSDAGTQASLSVDPNFPRFGPWTLFPQQSPTANAAPISPLQRTSSSSGGKAANNTTYLTRNGPPIVHDFYVKVDDGTGTFVYTAAAWKNDIRAGGDTPLPSTWKALPATLPAGQTVMPAPEEFANQMHADWVTAGAGDRFPLKTTTPSSPPALTDYATTVHEFVNFLVANPAVATGMGLPAPPVPVSTLDTNAYITPPPGASQQLNYAPGVPFNATQPALSTAFRDGTGNDTTRKHVWWETNGYGPNFKGYTIAPGYWGKTFYMWPPDPRAPVNDPGAVGYIPGDWRRRYFTNVNGDNATDGRTGANGAPLSDNMRLWDARFTSSSPLDDTDYGRWRSGPDWKPNYTAIIKWIKSGPQVFPPSLRSGRVLYYDSIPSTIPDSGGTLDQVFWRRYIEYVVNDGTYPETSWQYGRNLTSVVGSSTGTGTTDARRQNWPTSSTTAFYGDHIRITPKRRVVGQNSSFNNVDANGVALGDDPYMSYHDSPIHPRARLWFGPASMVNFITEAIGEAEMMAGTTHQSQCWQVKAGAQSALEDIQRNHPNDLMSLIYFSGGNTFLSYKEPRQVLSDQYDLMKKLLWYPYMIGGLKPLPDPASTPPLATGYLANDTLELRPFSDWNSANVNLIPHAAGSTCPEMGLMVAFNQFSARTGTVPMSGGKGRIGATKLVLFETDGQPNTTVNGGAGFTGTQPNLCQFNDITSCSGGSGASFTNAVNVVNRICMANASDTTYYPTSYSNGGRIAKCHAIAFGDLFEGGGGTTALGFLADVQAAGNTGSSTATTIESFKIIVGDFNNRINNMRLAYERIMQGDVQLSLIE